VGKKLIFMAKQRGRKKKRRGQLGKKILGEVGKS
jgi:hypothetical protein